MTLLSALKEPVSARNIVGDTSGTAVPSGMIGESIEAVSTFAAYSAGANIFENVASITLNTKGVYLIGGHSRFRNSSASCDTVLAISKFSGNVTTDHVVFKNELTSSIISNIQDSTISITPYIFVCDTAGTTLYIKSKQTSIGGFRSAFISAVRIA